MPLARTLKIVVIIVVLVIAWISIDAFLSYQKERKAKQDLSTANILLKSSYADTVNESDLLDNKQSCNNGRSPLIGGGSIASCSIGFQYASSTPRSLEVSNQVKVDEYNAKLKNDAVAYNQTLLNEGWQPISLYPLVDTVTFDSIDYSSNVYKDRCSVNIEVSKSSSQKIAHSFVKASCGWAQ